jgi:hypothetical protein
MKAMMKGREGHVEMKKNLKMMKSMLSGRKVETVDNEEPTSNP